MGAIALFHNHCCGLHVVVQKVNPEVGSAHRLDLASFYSACQNTSSIWEGDIVNLGLSWGVGVLPLSFLDNPILELSVSRQ